MPLFSVHLLIRDFSSLDVLFFIRWLDYPPIIVGIYRQDLSPPLCQMLVEFCGIDTLMRLLYVGLEVHRTVAFVRRGAPRTPHSHEAVLGSMVPQFIPFMEGCCTALSQAVQLN